MIDVNKTFPRIYNYNFYFPFCENEIDSKTVQSFSTYLAPTQQRQRRDLACGHSTMVLIKNSRFYYNDEADCSVGFFIFCLTLHKELLYDSVNYLLAVVNHTYQMNINRKLQQKQIVKLNEYFMKHKFIAMLRYSFTVLMK